MSVSTDLARAGSRAGSRRRTGGWSPAELAVVLLEGAGGFHTSAEQADFEARLVADLRRTAARYPADRSLKRLVSELAARSPRFVELWECGDPDPGQDPSRRKTIEHPAVGRITLDCDTVIVATDDLRIMVYTPEPATEDAERLALAVVLGTQTLVE